MHGHGKSTWTNTCTILCPRMERKCGCCRDCAWEGELYGADCAARIFFEVLFPVFALAPCVVCSLPGPQINAPPLRTFFFWFSFFFFSRGCPFAGPWSYLRPENSSHPEGPQRYRQIRLMRNEQAAVPLSSVGRPNTMNATASPNRMNANSLISVPGCNCSTESQQLEASCLKRGICKNHVLMHSAMFGEQLLFSKLSIGFRLAMRYLSTCRNM